MRSSLFSSLHFRCQCTKKNNASQVEYGRMGSTCHYDLQIGRTSTLNALHVSQPLVCSQSHSSYAYVSKSGTIVNIGLLMSTVE